MFHKLLIGLTVLVLAIGCDGGDPINMSPVIDALILPEKADAGEKVHLQVTIHDPDNDKLMVNWQVSEGSVDTATGTWTAPNRATTVEIEVFVSDGSNKAVSAKKSVQVISVELDGEPPPVVNKVPIEPLPITNMPPVIDALTLPDEVETGATVNLQVVKRDPENDNLMVNWQVSEGSLDIINEIWTAPKHETTVEITVFVSDGSNKAVSEKKSVEVVSMEIKPEPMDIVKPPEPPVKIEPPDSQHVDILLELGDRVVVTNTRDFRLLIRKPAGFDPERKNVIGSAADGATGKVFEGPLLGDDFTWWRIEWDANDKVAFNAGVACCIGWSAETNLW